MIKDPNLELWHRMPDCEMLEAVAEGGEGFEEWFGVDLRTVLNA